MALQDDDAFKKVLKVAQKAFKTLYEKGTYKPNDSLEVEAYKELTTITAGVLQKGITHEVPAELKNYLDKDVFVFSGLKTHAQLSEARSYLKDERGDVRSYEDFERLVTKLNENYNRNYLEAEYLFATSSAQSASNWHQFSDDTKRYYLQYRTASDDRVRDSHRVLHNVTLPKDDPFWDYYYTPNGWRCRCQVIEVLANKNTKSNSVEAMAKGDKATTIIGKNGKENKLFQFNPGKTKTVFPPNHAYSKVVGAKEVEKVLKKGLTDRVN
ncbi:phage head morphogenesis protein [Flavobacterium sp. TN-1]